MGDIAVPTSQQHMTAGFMSVTMEDVVRASVVKFFFVHFTLLCIPLFQSMLTKTIFTMFASAVLCSSGRFDVNVDEADHADDIALLVE